MSSEKKGDGWYQQSAIMQSTMTSIPISNTVPKHQQHRQQAIASTASNHFKMLTNGNVFRMLSLVASIAVASSFAPWQPAVTTNNRGGRHNSALIALAALKDNGQTEVVALRSQKNAAKNVFSNVLAAGLIALSTLTAPLTMVDMHPTFSVANAESRVIGEIQGSGIVFKVSKHWIICVLYYFCGTSIHLSDLSFRILIFRIH